MLRKTLLCLFVVGAIAGPYLYFEKGWRTSLSQQVSSWMPSQQNSTNSGNWREQGVAGESAVDARREMNEPTIHDIYAVFRFDRSVTWVMTNWKRVSTFDADQNLRGMRVPLVTGTQPDDLVGALTYYFDQDEKLQRISFHGTTKDDRKIVQLLTTKFHLEQESTYGTGRYASKWHGQPLSVLQVTPPAVRSEALLPRYDISCELNWPSGNHQLSASLQQVASGL